MNTNVDLYEKLGKERGIETMVLSFYARVFADPELAPFFRDVSFAKLYDMQMEFFTMALGGPAQYSGRRLPEAHHGLGITQKHFQRFVNHLLATLEEKGITHEEVGPVIDRINASANEIMGISY